MTRERLEELLAGFPKARVAIIGDFFLDLYQYVDRTLDEISIETGKVAYQVTSMRPTPGAAGTVASNLWRLEAGEIYAVGVIGDDGNGYALRQGLEQRNVCLDHLIVTPEKMTPTYTKPIELRPGKPPEEMNRFDIKNRQPLEADLETRLIEQLQQCAQHVDAIIVADQVPERNVGVITDRVREAILEIGQRGQPMIWVDSRERIGEFHHVILKPNRAEAYLALHPGEPRPEEDQFTLEQILDYGRRLRERNEGPVVITVGEQGAIVFDDAGYQRIPGFRVDGPIDVVGAGDSFTAASVLALCAGATLREAALCGVLVSSITVQKIGETGTATHEEVRARLEAYRKQIAG